MKRHFAISIICLFLCILAVPLTFSSCSYRGYRGDHADLYTVAVNNVFGISGHTGNGEISYDPAIDILETDDSYKNPRTDTFITIKTIATLFFSMIRITSIMERKAPRITFAHRNWQPKK